MTGHELEEQLSPLDVAFLALEHAAPMHLGALLPLTAAPGEDPPTVMGLAALLATRAARLPRLRQRITPTWSPPGGATWTTDPGFDVHTHVHTHQLPSGGGWDAVSALTEDLMRRPLELIRPPWALHVLGCLDHDPVGGRIMVLVTLHHALCDGAGAIRLGMSLLDTTAAHGVHAADGLAAPQSPSPSPVSSARPGRVLRTALSTATLAVNTAVSKATVAVRDPAGAARQARARLSAGTDIAVAVARQVRWPAPRSPLSAPVHAFPFPLPRRPPFTALRGPRLPRERLVRMIRLDDQDIRRVRHSHGGTSHDVLLTVLAGALRTWLASRGEPVETARVRALIPVDQRPRARGTGGANQVSGYLCDLPVDRSDPAARLAVVREAMQANKAAGPRRGAAAMALFAHAVPPAAHRVLTPLAARHARVLFDLVVTTVRLPAVPLTIGGAAVGEVYPLVPLTPGHALGVALCHHDGAVHVGLHADRDILPDLDKLAEAIPTALAEFADTTG
ncbi:wax ester/triacylglycerol synthase family O-acyltransferase [Amycolatopsis sp. EV170708-02-1]|uniref:wax ester/triacylglycerol synthase family O-acyltransferase n=1 Tax=Amycolatopsis sp. EV170708-02-1 TaxID=2919322 RepID=UPI001F0CBDD8|nr:wax ester/triacylglycerol synthase family O-acyltransferase [Amycolatopsis sp. EV170708-02-1]UMP06758.1 wax ester/triacylglycerol synthase family O-acyltransferase [Amycolatopsis sp. EV170708-02-1]